MSTFSFHWNKKHGHKIFPKKIDYVVRRKGTKTAEKGEKRIKTVKLFWKIGKQGS
jgi:hypothetical protein